MKEKEWYRERTRETLRELAHEQERLTDEAKRLEERRWMVEEMESLMDEHERLQEEAESLRQQLANERQKRTELEMIMNEMSKLSAGMAKKAAQDDFPSSSFAGISILLKENHRLPGLFQSKPILPYIRLYRIDWRWQTRGLDSHVVCLHPLSCRNTLSMRSSPTSNGQRRTGSSDA